MKQVEVALDNPLAFAELVESAVVGTVGAVDASDAVDAADTVDVADAEAATDAVAETGVVSCDDEIVSNS